jgi:hypothetical protein
MASTKFELLGRLCGYFCDECQTPLAGATLMLYGSAPGGSTLALAVAPPKETFAILSDEQIAEKKSRLLAEVVIGDDGSFRLTLGEKQPYAGDAFEIDVYCGTMPFKGGPLPPHPNVQFTVTTLQPMWRQSDGLAQAAFEYCLSARYWCAVLARLGLWVICGRLTTCSEPILPIHSATVKAFDVDWLQDDALGSALTDADGRFTIYYTRAQFDRTIFSPLINLEWTGGPDVYFRVEAAGAPILVEPPSKGRTSGRENVGHCLCVTLCTDNVPTSTPEADPHWTRVEAFNVHPSVFDPASNFLPEGYAGLASQSYVFGGAVALFGNCPLFNAAAPSHSLKYRFLIAEWQWSGGGDGTAGVMPAVPPAAPPSPLAPNAVWKIMPTTNGALPLGDIYYNDGVNPLASVPVRPAPDGAGFIKLIDPLFVINAPLSGGGTTPLTVASNDFLRSGLLGYMDTAAITSAHASRFPAWGNDKSQAGRAPTAAESEPIRRYRVIFEVRDATTDTAIFTDTLDSIVLDNTPSVALLNITELMENACNPITGLAEIHALFTLDHPHLRDYHLSISNNNGLVHGAPPMPSGAFSPPPPQSSYFFRGGTSGTVAGPANAVNISADPVCAYSLNMTWVTRHYVTGTQSLQVLYCKE